MHSDDFNSPLRITGARDAPIDSIGDWLCLAPPARNELHWKPGRSARELATAWLRPGRPAIPEELALLLTSAKETRHFACGLAVPEAKLELDTHKGNTRNADLLLMGTAAGGKTVVTVEAKADESFGEYVADELAKAPASSKKPDRIRTLSKLLFGAEFDPSGQRYQLIHGLAATVLEAQRRDADQAVFVIHEFRTPETDNAKHESNAQDLRYFMALFAAEYIQPGRLERVNIVGAPDLPVFVGITVTTTR